MLPTDSITSTKEVAGVGTTTISALPKHTILAVSMQQENTASLTTVKCGNNKIVAKNYGTNFSNVVMNYQCDGSILIAKTGNDKSTIIVTYLPYLTGDLSTTSEPLYSPTVMSTTSATTSDVKVYGSLTAGELLISTILLMMFILKTMELLAKALSGVNLKRTLLKYRGGDVPMDTE